MRKKQFTARTAASDHDDSSRRLNINTALIAFGGISALAATILSIIDQIHWGFLIAVGGYAIGTIAYLLFPYARNRLSRVSEARHQKQALLDRSEEFSRLFERFGRTILNSSYSYNIKIARHRAVEKFRDKLSNMSEFPGVSNTPTTHQTVNFVTQLADYLTLTKGMPTYALYDIWNSVARSEIPFGHTQRESFLLVMAVFDSLVQEFHKNCLRASIEDIRQLQTRVGLQDKPDLHAYEALSQAVKANEQFVEDYRQFAARANIRLGYQFLSEQFEVLPSLPALATI